MAKSSWDWNAFRLAVIEAGIRGELTADWRAANPDVEPAHVLLERIAEEKAEPKRAKGRGFDLGQIITRALTAAGLMK